MSISNVKHRLLQPVHEGYTKWLKEAEKFLSKYFLSYNLFRLTNFLNFPVTFPFDIL